MLHLQIDPHRGIPVFRQLMDQIRYYVAAGSLTPGDRLPSIRELARTLAVNPTTVVKTYSELEHEGVLERVHGKGVFVAEALPRPSRNSQQKALRPLARQLATEAVQMGAADDLVFAILRAELEALRPEGES